MDILEQAIEFEYYGHKFYTDHAIKTQDIGVRGILENLAGDELMHAEYLKLLKAGARKDLPPTRSMHRIKEIIETSSLRRVDFLSKETGIADVLKAALELEERAKKHYTEESIAAEEEAVKVLLRKLAQVEETHYRLIEGLLKFMDNPKNILETQEFQFYDK